jgi:hypothetical protein
MGCAALQGTASGKVRIHSAAQPRRAVPENPQQRSSAELRMLPYDCPARLRRVLLFVAATL